MKKKTLCALALFMGTITSFYGCGDEDTIIGGQNYIQSIGGGSCLFVNHNTKDSLLINGGINLSHPECINVHNGDMLEMTFIPDNDFEKFNFTVTYTLMDGTQRSCTNYDYTYKFTVSEWGTTDGSISFNAICKDENTDIKAGGSINVRLLENN